MSVARKYRRGGREKDGDSGGVAAAAAVLLRTHAWLMDLRTVVAALVPLAIPLCPSPDPNLRLVLVAFPSSETMASL